jgi:outer membrane protein OmpA-like peptidoglycan-associated protein
VDPVTLPPGTEFTTDNPLVRRVTPGLPVRMDFGAKLPPGRVGGGSRAQEVEIGEILFQAGTATVRGEYAPVITKIAEQLRAHPDTALVIAASGESSALAYDRAKAVQSALLAVLTPEQAQALQVELRSDLANPDSSLLALGLQPELGQVLFDTDRATLRPEFAPVIAKLASDIEAWVKSGKPAVISVVGHADRRGSSAHNDALGLRRAKAVYDAIAAQLSPEARAQLRVEVNADPTAPLPVEGPSR